MTIYLAVLLPVAAVALVWCVRQVAASERPESKLERDLEASGVVLGPEGV